MFILKSCQSDKTFILKMDINISNATTSTFLQGFNPIKGQSYLAKAILPWS